MVFHHSTYNSQATVVLYGGKEGDPTPFAEAYTHSRDRTIDYTILPPSDRNGEGFKQVVTMPTQSAIYADGLLLPPLKTASIRSKDCPIVFIKNVTTGWGVMLHAGRAACRGNLLPLEHDFDGQCGRCPCRSLFRSSPAAS